MSSKRSVVQLNRSGFDQPSLSLHIRLANPVVPLGHAWIAFWPNMVRSHQIPDLKEVGQESYTTETSEKKNMKQENLKPPIFVTFFAIIRVSHDRPVASGGGNRSTQ